LPFARQRRANAAAEAIELLVSEGWQWVFIDTGPARIDLIEPGIAVADLVLIPTRPSALDIEQAAICVELCETHGKPHAFVFNHAPAGTKITKSSIKFLRQNGSTVLDAAITFRPAYMAAATVGKSAPEVEKGDVARKEIDAVWAAVLDLLGTHQ
jgi:chromosome partitioning protein